MNNKNINGHDIEIITESSALASICAAWREKSYITIDTEFLRSSSYWPHLCLIQMGHDGQGVLIDPLSTDMDLTPFFDLMVKPDIVKVFHAARQDIEIFYHIKRCLPMPLFDTQIAAMVCGFGDAVSYEILVKSLIGSALDKSSRVTDWSQRPLTQRQMIYALSDVTHLCEIYKILSRRLDKEDRRNWIMPEFAAMTRAELYENNPEQAWRILKFSMKTDKQQAMMMAAAAWREKEAQRVNKPRGWIMRDDLIRDVALAAANDMPLKDVRSMPKNILRSRGSGSLIGALADAEKFESKIEKLKKGRRNQSDAPSAMLKLLLKVQCEKHSVAPKLVASSQMIEDFAGNMDKELPFLSGWRNEVFGQYARALLQGEISLSLHQGKPEIVKTRRSETKPRAQALS